MKKGKSNWLKEAILKAPTKTGVYIFYGPKNQVLYVGRALNLKNRLKSYLSSREPRLKELINQASKLDYQTSATFLESVILEANLIKKYWPKYNIRERDDRSFLYLVIDPTVDFPRPVIIRGRQVKKISPQAKIFGPFKSERLLRTALKIVRRIFPYSLCRPNQGYPCFDYQIGLCPGVCVGRISAKEYQKNITNIILLFSGQKKRLLNKLKKENIEAWQALKNIEEAALISEEADFDFPFFRIEAYDISHLAGKETYGAMSVLINGRLAKEEYRLFKIKTAPSADDLRALAEVILRRLKHEEWPKPDLIILDGGRPQLNFLTKILEPLHFKIPLVGISKYQNDRLVYSPSFTKEMRNLIEQSKNYLLIARNEAHRFSLKASRRKRKLA